MTTRMTVHRLNLLIANGDVEAVRTAIAAAPQLLTRTVARDGEGGWTPLHVAVAEGREDVVRVLVAAGADLTARTERSRTPLHVALRHARSLVAPLRELGAVLDAPSAAYLDEVDQLERALADGAPPTGDLLTWAAHGGAAGTTRLLLDRGADVDGGALHAAAGRSRLELVRVLLAAGADVDRREPDSGRTPLHAAVAAGTDGDAPEVVRILLAAGADIDATTNDGATALDIGRVAAARARHDGNGRATSGDALVDLLVAHGASD
jgi:ankyrin repeat protein